MTDVNWIAAGVVATTILISDPAAAACNSGPDFCTDDPRIAVALEKKKQTLRKEYPERLVALLDRGVQCVARIERSPNAFTMWIVRPGDTRESVLWSLENEAAAKKEIAGGIVLHFWIVDAQRAFACDGEKPYHQRSDYDKTDDVNTSLAILCDKNGCQS